MCGVDCVLVLVVVVAFLSLPCALVVSIVSIECGIPLTTAKEADCEKEIVLPEIVTASPGRRVISDCQLDACAEFSE